MPETGTSILGYIGNSNLGVGENSAIPVSADHPDLKAVREANTNMRAYDHQNNVLLYQQKVQDRDNALKLLAEGKVQAGNILPENKKDYDAAEQKQTDAYKAIKGMNDKDGISAYIQATKELKDVATMAQHKWLEVTKLEAEKSAKTLPGEIAAYDNHIKQQVAKPLGELVDPYQQAQTMDLDAMYSGIKAGQVLTKGVAGNLPELQQPGVQTSTVTKDSKGNVTTKQTIKSVPPKAGTTTAKAAKVGTTGIGVTQDGQLSEFSQSPDKYYDYPTMEKRAADLYFNDATQSEYQRQHFNTFHSMPQAAQEEKLIAEQKRINSYYQQRGIEPDANGNYPNDIKFHIITTGPNGNAIATEKLTANRFDFNKLKPTDKIVLDETIPSFAAKSTLAAIEGDYVEKGQRVFNKDVANYLLGKEKATTDAFYKRNMAAAAGMKARAYVANMHSQIAKRNGDNEKDNFLDEIYNRNLTEQSKLIVPGKGNGEIARLADIDANKSLPIFTFSDKGFPTILKPIGATPKIETLTNANGQKYEKITGYEGGHYDQQYIYNGKALTANDLADMYKSFKDEAGKKWTQGFDEYLKGAISSDLFNVKLIGANGSTDRMMSRAAQRAMSNKMTKKGQDAVFEPPIDETITEETQ